MKSSQHNYFSRGGVNQVDRRPVTVFVPDDKKEEEAPQGSMAAQVLKREKPKVVRSKYQRG